MRIGIMQGRLLPPAGSYQCFPAEGWEREFAAAAQAGLQCIEWIYDVGAEQANPLGSEEGQERMRNLSQAHGVAVRSVCADYFMERPLLRCGEAELESRLATLRWLLQACARMGAGRVVLPFVDNSRMETSAERRQVAQALARVLPDAAATGVELHLETALAPPDFETFLDALPDPLVRVTYDSGNSASLGFPVAEEWSRYGPRIGSVHIKDRVRGGGSVPLGSGDADFPELFAWIRKSGYDGDLILQAARREPGEELALARENRGFVERCLAACA